MVEGLTWNQLIFTSIIEHPKGERSTQSCNWHVVQGHDSNLLTNIKQLIISFLSWLLSSHSVMYYCRDVLVWHVHYVSSSLSCSVNLEFISNLLVIFHQSTEMYDSFTSIRCSNSLKSSHYQVFIFKSFLSVLHQYNSHWIVRNKQKQAWVFFYFFSFKSIYWKILIDHLHQIKDMIRCTRDDGDNICVASENFPKQQDFSLNRFIPNQG